MKRKPRRAILISFFKRKLSQITFDLPGEYWNKKDWLSKICSFDKLKKELSLRKNMTKSDIYLFGCNYLNNCDLYEKIFNKQFIY